MTMKYKAIIYDLDGTIIDSKKDIATTTNATLKKMGSETLPEKTIYGYVGRGVSNLLLQAIPQKDPESQKRAMEIFREHYLEHCLDETRLYPGVFELLEELHKKQIKQAIFTNKSQIFTDKIVKGLEIAHFFEVCLGSNGTFPIKPDPAGTRFILERMNTKAQETLFVGDSEVDLKTAENLGMDCVLLLGGYTKNEEIHALKDRACICKNFFELRKTLFTADCCPHQSSGP